MKKFIFFIFIIGLQIESIAQDSSIVFTIDYQKSKHEWAVTHLLHQESSVTCSGETIFFSGKINHSSVSRLFRLVNMKYSVEHNEIAGILSEMGVSYHTDMPSNPRCDNNYIQNEKFYI